MADRMIKNLQVANSELLAQNSMFVDDINTQIDQNRELEAKQQNRVKALDDMKMLENVNETLKDRVEVLEAEVKKAKESNEAYKKKVKALLDE